MSSRKPLLSFQNTEDREDKDMRKKYALIASALIALAGAQAQADLIPVARNSYIHGEGIGTTTQTAQTTDLFSDFAETFSASGNPGYIEQYTIGQSSGPSFGGFYLQTSASGSVSSGDFASVSTQTYFDLGFYVTEPSVLTLVLDYPHPLGGGGGGVGFTFDELGRSGEQLQGRIENYFSFGGGQVPGSFTLIIPLSAAANVGYFIHLNDGDNVDSFGQRPRAYSFSGQFVASLSPFRVRRVERLAAGIFKISFPTQAGLNYQLQYSADLTSWSNVVGAVVFGDGSEKSLTDTRTEKAYWRVAVSR